MKLIRMGRLALAVAAVGLGLTLVAPAPAGAATPVETTCAVNGAMFLDSGVFLDGRPTSGTAYARLDTICAGTFVGSAVSYGAGPYTEGGLTPTGSYNMHFWFPGSFLSSEYCLLPLQGTRAGTALVMNGETSCLGGGRGPAVLSVTYTPIDVVSTSTTPTRHILVHGTLTFTAL